LAGAVVEVFFTMRHYYLHDKKFDTFQGEIQQIKIVKLGGSIATSGIKRPRDLAGVLEQEGGEGHHGCPPNIIRGVRNRDMQ